MPERTGLAAQAPGVLVRKVHDHSMPGVDVAVTAFPERDPQRGGVQKILDDAISAKLCVTADASGGARVEVTLRSEKVGHSFPSGAAQDRRAWVELEGTRRGVVAFTSGRIPEGKAVASSADSQILLLRDYHFDADDRATGRFWLTKRVKSDLLPVAASLRSPDAERSVVHVYSFPGAMPDSVKMRVKIRPLDFDLLEDLVASGDLAPELAASVHTFDLASTQLAWLPGTDCVATR